MCYICYYTTIAASFYMNRPSSEATLFDFGTFMFVISVKSVVPWPEFTRHPANNQYIRAVRCEYALK